MLSEYFIRRPVFAWIIAIVIMLGGALALTRLPVARYPNIAPPTVAISASFPGADARTIESSVTQVLEQGLTGLDDLQYMSASSDSNGSVEISLTFSNTANPDVAQMQVQNKLQRVTPLLPSIVQSLGLTVTKSSPGFLMIAGFVSTDGKLSSTDLGDYVNSTLNDTIRRVPGVGNTVTFGDGYAMRLWLNPDRLAQYALMPSDVEAAVRAQNTQVAVGQLGMQPAREGQQLNATVTAQSRLQTPEQFGDIILKSAADGSLVRLGDVARIELGAQSYGGNSTYNGLPASGLAIQLAAGANALTTAQAVKAALAALATTLPAGVQIVDSFDTTPFIERSIHEVVTTLIEAMSLVFIIMLLFLQNLRATLIPTLAIPVVLLGTLGVLAILGYSINMLTLFAMVLAIGLLVDDAIVVVENVERVMVEEKLSPREATRKSMREITGALIGIATVLSAVFIPMAFFPGSTGIIYRQFAVTIVSAMLLSVAVALILTPALCATILQAPKYPGTGHSGLAWLNHLLERATQQYRRAVRAVIARVGRFLMVFLGIAIAMAVMFTVLPGSFIPPEDQGALMAIVQLPPGAMQDRTQRALDRITRYFLDQEKEAVQGVMAVNGFGFGGSGQNTGTVFIHLKDFGQRHSPRLSAKAVAQRAGTALRGFRDGQVYVVLPQAIEGMGNSGGFDFYLEDAGGTGERVGGAGKDAAGSGRDRLNAARDQLLAAAANDPHLANTRPTGQEDTPQFSITIDQARASALGLRIADIYDTLSIAWGSHYINDFIDRGRVKRVYLQSDVNYRMQPQDLNGWFVRNVNGNMVPFSSFATGHWKSGPARLERYNGRPALEIQGDAAPGVSSGSAMRAIDRLVAGLPPGLSHEWTGLSYQERLSGDQAAALYAISVLVVFLCLAALYESWSIPLAVVLAAPIGIAGALLAALLCGQANDVYFKVGLLTTIGLAAKNAILIVEFALDRQARGAQLMEATLDAAGQRLRPILMTSFAFILGVAPLAFATGAGSGAQNAIGRGVMGGMVATTALGIFFVPLLFVLVRRVFPAKALDTDLAESALPAAVPGPAGTPV